MEMKCSRTPDKAVKVMKTKRETVSLAAAPEIHQFRPDCQRGSNDLLTSQCRRGQGRLCGPGRPKPASHWCHFVGLCWRNMLVFNQRCILTPLVWLGSRMLGISRFIFTCSVSSLNRENSDLHEQTWIPGSYQTKQQLLRFRIQRV